jgi:hypothetical protein
MITLYFGGGVDISGRIYYAELLEKGLDGLLDNMWPDVQEGLSSLFEERFSCDKPTLKVNGEIVSLTSKITFERDADAIYFKMLFADHIVDAPED